MDKKSIIEDCLILDINRLFRKRVLNPDISYSGTINWQEGSSISMSVGPSGLEDQSLIMTLSYQHNKRPIVFDIPIVTTPCNYGGRRYWFCCPGLTMNAICDRKVAKLYLPPYGERFACRRCYDLSYRSRQTWNSRTEIGMCFQILNAGREMEEALKLGRKGEKKIERIGRKLEGIAIQARKRGIINGI
jgi:hypothetical protein